ncbi:hypothetical protein HaLaN_02342 [Haematococcus lacustris]|uniref:Uncharacterized protein n=1 Tax=Haematococcus lacustris TaxID=44745 RepID=A0A699YBH8_HAELA|nr:hypothetical protein HaLaN_02342 [Haematococcus lacustris]
MDAQASSAEQQKIAEDIITSEQPNQVDKVEAGSVQPEDAGKGERDGKPVEKKDSAGKVAWRKPAAVEAAAPLDEQLETASVAL